MDIATQELTYSEVGATRGDLPSGYEHLRRVQVIGAGEAVFKRARQAVLTWDVQRRAGLHVTAQSPTVREGDWVKVRLGPRFIGVTAPCRVVYVVDEERRCGFAYGTLAGHPERGEESFTVEWRDDDTVEFHVVAFSRPATWWSRAGAPVTHLIQKFVTRRYLNALR